MIKRLAIVRFSLSIVFLGIFHSGLFGLANNVNSASLTGSKYYQVGAIDSMLDFRRKVESYYVEHLKPQLLTSEREAFDNIDLMPISKGFVSVLESIRLLRDRVCYCQDSEAADQKKKLLATAAALKCAPVYASMVRDELVEVLDALEHCLNYWTMQSRHQAHYFLHKSPLKWFSKQSQQQEISGKIQLIYQKRDHYHKLLGKLDRCLNTFLIDADVSSQIVWIEKFFSITDLVVHGKLGEELSQKLYSLPHREMLDQVLWLAKQLMRRSSRVEQVITSVKPPHYVVQHWLACVSGTTLLTAASIYAFLYPNKVTEIRNLLTSRMDDFINKRHQDFTLLKAEITDLLKKEQPGVAPFEQRPIDVNMLEELIEDIARDGIWVFEDEANQIQQDLNNGDPRSLIDVIKRSINKRTSSTILQGWVPIWGTVPEIGATLLGRGPISKAVPLITESLLNRAQRVYGSGVHMYQRADRKLNVLFATLGVVGTTIGLYAGGKTLYKLYSLIKGGPHDFTPLRCALLDVDHILLRIQESGRDVNDADWGRLLYGIIRASREIDHISEPDRWHFESQVRELGAHGISPYYKRELLGNMFKRYDFLQHVPAVA